MPPALALVVLLAVLVASTVHALFGRSWRGWAVTLLAALVGFAAGEALGRALGHLRGVVGQVHVVHGVLGAVVATAAAVVAERRAP
ncbi:hypothetical protein DCC79_11305 [bacterium]|nr:hypothetical protein [Chloroflexi bacterium CFX6]RIL09344.1 MAG: hypothetical protein DCC79_11305 [bacterium]